MNVFTNSILQIIYYLFYNVLSDKYLCILAFASAFFYVIGTIYAYVHYRQKVKLPIIYVIPGLRVLAILFRNSTKKNERLSFVVILSYALGAVSLIATVLSENLLIGLLGIILIQFATLCGSYLNYDFLCYCDEIREKDRSLIKGILYYFFPSAYLYITAPSKTKPKGAKSFVAILLVFTVGLQTLICNPIKTYAEERPHLETGCQICDDNEQIIYRFVIGSYDETNATNVYHNYYGVTTLQCEIVHLVETNEDFEFEYIVNGASVDNNFTRVIAFVDYSKTYLGIDGYHGTLCDIDDEFGVIVSDEYWIKDHLDMGVFSSGVINSFTNEEQIGTPLLPLLNLVQYDVYAGYEDSSNANVYVPKGDGKSNVPKSEDNVLGENNYEVITEVINENNETTDSAKWSVEDTIDVTAGIVAGTASVVGIGTGVAYVLTGVTAINPILGGILWGCTVVIAGASAYMFSASIGEKVFTGYIDNSAREEEKAIARKELKKELIVTTCSLALGSCIVSYVKPQIAGVIEAAFVVKIETTPELIDHLENPALKGNVISGGHNESSFINFCEDNGIKYELVDANLPEGMKKYSYAVPDKINGGYKGTRFKTVYDNVNMSLNDYVQYGTNLINQKALEEKWMVLPSGEVNVKDPYSTNWRYYFNDGKVSTFYPIN